MTDQRAASPCLSQGVSPRADLLLSLLPTTLLCSDMYRSLTRNLSLSASPSPHPVFLFPSHPLHAPKRPHRHTFSRRFKGHQVLNREKRQPSDLTEVMYLHPKSEPDLVWGQFPLTSFAVTPQYHTEIRFKELFLNWSLDSPHLRAGTKTSQNFFSVSLLSIRLAKDDPSNPCAGFSLFSTTWEPPTTRLHVKQCRTVLVGAAMCPWGAGPHRCWRGPSLNISIASQMCPS